jgi:hypothetical protein
VEMYRGAIARGDWNERADSGRSVLRTVIWRMNVRNSEGDGVTVAILKVF